MTTEAATKAAEDLIISEYIEGTSYNKAIELYNGTGSDVDLSQYSLERHSNGAVEVGSKINLSGTLESGDTYVLHHEKANDDIKSKGDLVDSSVINFNGNDPVVLKKGETIVDSIGQIGTDADWGKDVSLVRKQ